MPKVFIDGVEYVEKPQPMPHPKNDKKATHWAVCPDGEILFYRIGDKVSIWLPYSKMWDTTGLVPYTLHSFTDSND